MLDLVLFQKKVVHENSSKKPNIISELWNGKSISQDPLR